MKNFLKSEPRSLEELRKSLVEDESAEKNFISILEDHHDYLKESISVLRDKDATPNDKQHHLNRFLHVLNMHAMAEEETLYRALMASSDKEARIGGRANQDEHDLAYQLGDDIRDLDFESQWTEELDAKAKVLATLVHNHIKDEESTLFPLAKSALDEDEMSSLNQEYLSICTTYLDQEMEEDRRTYGDSPNLSH